MPSSEDALRLQAMFEFAIDGIIVINHRGIIEEINPAAVKLFGYSTEEVIGRNVSMLMSNPHRDAHDGYINRYQETRKARIIGIGREVEGLKKDGTHFPFSLGVVEVKLQDRIIYTGFVHDLSTQKSAEKRMMELNHSLEEIVEERTNELTKTVNRLLKVKKELEHEVLERKKAEDALLASEFELKEALQKEKVLNELKTRFVSMASHEFRTPLSTIMSSAALTGRYEEGDQQDKRMKHINRIKNSVQHMTGILNDFLSIGKLEEGLVGIQLEVIDLSNLTQSVVEGLHGILKSHQEIVITDSLATSSFSLDQKMVRNIMINLLSNAIKYSPEGSTIQLRLDQVGEEIRIQVQDQGIGIPEEEQAHLFSRFFRAANAMNIKGTGLGLNIVKSYLDLLNGRISFVSKQGEGSTFTVYLPTDLG